jgi:2-oxoglutarate/2-oxoacid ferredoxin oxidoreductase subunit alpha
MWTLGLVLWMFGRDVEQVEAWLTAKFGATPEVMNANIAALRAGHAFGETAELGESIRRFDIPAAPVEPGTYRTVTGSETLAWGLYAGARLANLDLFFGSYPITPASPMLHAPVADEAPRRRDLPGRRRDRRGVRRHRRLLRRGPRRHHQFRPRHRAEDGRHGARHQRRAAAGGRQCAARRPLDRPADQDRAGRPLQAIFGRNGDTQLPVIAAATPGDCFACAIEAVRLAVTHMTPVMLLSDGYIANAAEPWKLPGRDLEPFPAKFRTDPEGFHPYLRDPDTLARPWVRPGTPGLQHRIGGLEKDYDSGNISYDPKNHQRMTDARTGKLKKIAAAMAPQAIDQGEAKAIWRWSAGAPPMAPSASRSGARGRGAQRVSHIHIRNVWPLPPNLGEPAGGFPQGAGARAQHRPAVDAAALGTADRRDAIHQGRGPALQGVRNERRHRREPGVTHHDSHDRPSRR